MENLNIKINLSKLNGVVKIHNEKKNADYIAIPIKENFLYQGEKGVYLNLTAFQQKEVKFGDSHYIKNQIPSDVYNKMTDEEKKNQSILGSCKPFILEDKSLQKVDSQEFTGLDNDEDDAF